MFCFIAGRRSYPVQVTEPTHDWTAEDQVISFLEEVSEAVARQPGWGKQLVEELHSKPLLVEGFDDQTTYAYKGHGPPVSRATVDAFLQQINAPFDRPSMLPPVFMPDGTNGGGARSNPDRSVVRACRKLVQLCKPGAGVEEPNAETKLLAAIRSAPALTLAEHRQPRVAPYDPPPDQQPGSRPAVVNYLVVDFDNSTVGMFVGSTHGEVIQLVQLACGSLDSADEVRDVAAFMQAVQDSENDLSFVRGMGWNPQTETPPQVFEPLPPNKDTTPAFQRFIDDVQHRRDLWVGTATRNQQHGYVVRQSLCDALSAANLNRPPGFPNLDEADGYPFDADLNWLAEQHRPDQQPAAAATTAQQTEEPVDALTSDDLLAAALDTDTPLLPPAPSDGAFRRYVISLKQKGWSNRAIAEHVGVSTHVVQPITKGMPRASRHPSNPARQP